MAKLKITQTSTSGQLVDAYVSPTLINGTHFGGTGGNTAQTGQQIRPTVFIAGGSQLVGNILAQKGAHKFRVTDGTLVGICTLANTGTLAAGQMNITITKATYTAANLAAANVVGGATTTYMTYATANVAGPAPIKIGDPIVGFVGNATTSYVTAFNATVAGLANVTVSITGNVIAQNAVNVSQQEYATRISNKFVYDFDGEKFRYHLSAPDSIFVQVGSA